jgi:hypothetical protein
MTALQPLSFSKFEQLPNEVIGEILAQGAWQTGSDGIVNHADIPVVFHQARSLALTSTRLYSAVNSPSATRLFTESLCRKFGKSPQHFASLLNTSGARKWIWDETEKNGDMKAYQLIQRIYAVASQMSAEAQQIGLAFDFVSGPAWWLVPKPPLSQTKKGVILYVDSFPHHLGTPFGEVRIFGEGCWSGSSAVSVTEVMLRRLGGTFQGIAHEHLPILELPLPNAEAGNSMRPIGPGELQPISLQEMQSRIGSKTLIMSPSAAYTVEGDLPVEFHASREQFRGDEAVRRVWEMLETHRTGGDPVATVSVSREKPSLPPHPTFADLSTLTTCLLKKIHKLQKQPKIQRHVYGSLCHSQEILVRNAGFAHGVELYLKLCRQIDSRAGFASQKTHKNGLTFLQSFTPADRIKKPFETLDSASLAVSLKLRSGWMRAKLKDFPEIPYTQSEETHELFIKQEPLQDEVCFLQFSAAPLGIASAINCNDHWKQTVPARKPPPIYLWVRKDRLPEVTRKLGLDI